MSYSLKHSKRQIFSSKKQIVEHLEKIQSFKKTFGFNNLNSLNFNLNLGISTKFIDKAHNFYILKETFSTTLSSLPTTLNENQATIKFAPKTTKNNEHTIITTVSLFLNEELKLQNVFLNPVLENTLTAGNIVGFTAPITTEIISKKKSKKKDLLVIEEKEPTPKETK
jgi:hypothetical protein